MHTKVNQKVYGILKERKKMSTQKDVYTQPKKKNE